MLFADALPTPDVFAAPNVVMESLVEAKPLFVLCDAGETKAFIPVLYKLQEKKRDFQVVVFGTASTLVTSGMYPNKVVTLHEIGVNELVDTSWPPAQGLSAESLEKIKERFTPSVVVCGVASKVQQQFFQTFKECKRVAYADKFCYREDIDNFQLASSIANEADYVYFATALSQQQMKPFLSTGKNLVVVGQPALEVWYERISEIKGSLHEQRRLCKRIHNNETNAPW